MQRIPYIDYINDYILYIEDKEKKEKNDNLLYFKNLLKISKVSCISVYLAWLLCIICAIIYAVTSDNYGKINLKANQDESLNLNSQDDKLWIIQLDVAFLPLISMNFIVPLIFRTCEAWSNAVMSQLFDQLLEK